jgi:hypothetical protein
MLVREPLTGSALPKIRRYDGKNRNDLGDYPHEYVHHYRGELQVGKELETPEERFDALKKNDESILAFTEILNLIRDVGITKKRVKL